jgi:hypothetical protein
MRAVTLRYLLRHYLRAEGGGVMPLIGLASVALIATMGLAIDVGRATLVYAKLLTSADASGLAVGARLNSTDLNAEAKKFVNGNFPAGFAGATVKDVTASANADGSIITVKATAVMPTTLLQLVGVNSVDLKVTSEVTRAVSGLELVLALDNTGSMAGSKMTSLKKASNDLLDIVFGDNATPDDLFVGVVPFSQAVNINTSRLAWTKSNAVSGLEWGTNHGWAGCVEERMANGWDTTDEPPSNNSRRFTPYYWSDNSTSDSSDWRDDDYNPNDWRDWTKSNGNTTYKYSISFQRDSDDRSPNKGCPPPITQMTRNKATVVGAISDMTAVGNTHINVGAVWGWRMLSPRWRGRWTGGDMATYKLPLDYNTPRMNKAIVIMTDGDNTMSQDIYTAFGFLSQERLGNDNGDSVSTQQKEAEASLDAKLLSVCNSMKNNGIIIYTVAFGSLASSTEDLLESCATQSDYFFSSPTPEQLTVAFKTIGDSLSNLRVSR